jgi:DNA repair protein RadC
MSAAPHHTDHWARLKQDAAQLADYEIWELLIGCVLLREYMARYGEAPVRRKEVLCTPEAVPRMARARLAPCPHEALWIVTDHGNRLIAWECLRRGTAGHVFFTPCDMLEMTLTHQASNTILVHNHPGGNARPSSPDLRLTRELARLASSLEITLLDHVVVTEDSCYSLMRDVLSQEGATMCRPGRLP